MKKRQAKSNPALHGVAMRWMAPSDIPSLARMERFSADPFGRLDLRDAMVMDNVCGVCAYNPERTDERCGYLLFEYGRHAIRLMRICVQPYLRRRGIALMMLQCFRETQIRSGRFNTSVAHVPEPCLSAQLLFRKAGYVCDGEVYSGDKVEYRFIGRI